MIKNGMQIQLPNGEQLTVVSFNISKQEVTYSHMVPGSEPVSETIPAKQWKDLISGQSASGVKLAVDQRYQLRDKSEWKIIELDKDTVLSTNVSSLQSKPYERATFEQLVTDGHILFL